MTASGLNFAEKQAEQASLTQLARQNIFPTVVFQGQIKDSAEINASVLKSVYAEFDKNSSARAANDTEAVSWRSAGNLHRNSQFEALRREIEAALAMVSLELGYSKDYRLKITSMRANINPVGSSSPAACRPGNLWSGCYGVQVPKGTGSTKFIDPRTINVMNPPKYEKDEKPRDCFTKITFKPGEGRLVIFPAWLYHEVEPNVAKEKGRAGDYVYISFSAVQARK